MSGNNPRCAGIKSFDLNESESKMAVAFVEKHHGMGHGSTYRYIFTPTGIGDKVVIKCVRCKKKKDISDYDSW